MLSSFNFIFLVMTIIVVSITFTSSLSWFVFAEVEPISHKSFSIYDFFGGLWQLNLNVFHHTAYTTNPDADTSGSDSISTRVSDLMTPDFLGSCTVEGRPGFPTTSKRKVYGLPSELDVGTGNSRVVVCALTVNQKAWNNKKVEQIVDEETGRVVGTSRPLVPKKIGMKLPSTGVTTSDLYVVPNSMNTASLYQVTRFSSIKNKKERAFYEKKYSIPVSWEADQDEGEFPLPVYIVTHTGKLDVKHQFKVFASNQNSKEMNAMMGTLPPRAKHGLAQTSTVFTPVYTPPADDEENSNNNIQEQEDVNDCSMQLTRVSALLTTKTDAILNIAVKYRGGELCFGEEEEEEEEAVSEETPEDGEEKDKKNKKNKKKDRKEIETSHLFFINSKRFADMDSEEMYEPDTPWYMRGKYAPSLGAFALLFVIIGGRKGVHWYLKRKGIDVEKFLSSTKIKTKQQIMQMRAERAKMKGVGFTEEEIDRLQREEQMEQKEKAFGKPKEKE